MSIYVNKLRMYKCLGIGGLSRRAEKKQTARKSKRGKLATQTLNISWRLFAPNIRRHIPKRILLQKDIQTSMKIRILARTVNSIYVWFWSCEKCAPSDMRLCSSVFETLPVESYMSCSFLAQQISGFICRSILAYFQMPTLLILFIWKIENGGGFISINK